MRATWFLAVAGPAFATDAPPAEKPAPEVGDVIEYIDCKRWEVKEVKRTVTRSLSAVTISPVP
jgi:hypothetical protein